MDAASLLAEVEGLAHSARVRRLVDLGFSAARGEGDAVATLAGLRASDEVYARLLALQAVFGSRDGAAVLSALADPSRTVRQRATALVPWVCDDAQVTAAFARLPTARRPALLVNLRRQRRGALIDRLVQAAHQRGDRNAIDLAAYASQAVVDETLPRLDGEGGSLTWLRFARWHPTRVASALGARLADSSDAVDPRLRLRLASVVETLAERAPDAVLSLVSELHTRGERVSVETLKRLVRRRPTETFDLLRAQYERGRPTTPPGAFAGVSFDTVADRLGGVRLTWLVAHVWETLSDGDRARRWSLRLSAVDRETVVQTWLHQGRGAWGAFLLRFVPPGEARVRAAARWSAAAQDRDGVIALHLLAPLPHDLRIAEARRHLDSVLALTSRPRDRAAYAGLLPFDAARAELSPFLGHPEGEERAAALTSLVSCGRHDRAHLGDLLDLLHGRRFEQDPVRMAMLRGLVALPQSCFTAELLPRVGLILRDALDAADLSYGTAAAVEQLVVRLFRVDAAWGATWLTTLLQTRGSVSAGGLGLSLSVAQVRVMSPVLAELAVDWATRERAFALIWLASSLGNRLTEVEPLRDALERLATELPFAGVAGGALQLLRRHDGPRFRRLVPALLAVDASYIVLPDLARHVSMHRQDLLDPFVEAGPMKGRFASGRTRWVIDFQVGYVRWTPLQQVMHAEALARVALDEKRDVPAVRAAVERLPALVFAPSTALLTLAGDPRPPVRELAVRALPWLDAGEGVPVLLACLGDDRARWAIYALRKAFAEMSREQTMAVLKAAPIRKVTVAKEVVRLLGELGGDEAWRALMDMDRPDVHRDVRIAVLRGLWDHLHRAETWGVFERAARDPDWVVASRLADLPLDRLSVETESRVLGLLVQVLGRAEPEARLALLARAATLPVRDVHRVLFARLLDRMGAPTTDESSAAFTAVLARMLPAEVDRIVTQFRSLFPRRRTLLALLEVLHTRLGPYAPQAVLRIADQVSRALAAEPLLLGPTLHLAGALLGWRELAALFIELSRQGRLHADAVAAALAATRECVHPELLESALSTQADAQLRRLALEALRSAAGPQEGWTLPRRARLETHRADPAPLVAEAAQLTFPPDA